VRLYLSDVTPGWNVTIDPPPERKKYMAYGEVREVEENICVNPPGLTGCKMPDGTPYPPGDGVKEIPSEIPEGIEYIQIYEGIWVPSRVATVRVEIPEDAKPGDVGSFSITAVGWCLDVAGMIMPRQVRNWDYSVRVFQKEYVEEAIVETPVAPETGVTPAPEMATTPEIIYIEKGIPYWVYLIIAVLVVVILAQALLRRR
jgi:hypothetical protein